VVSRFFHLWELHLSCAPFALRVYINVFSDARFRGAGDHFDNLKMPASRAISPRCLMVAVS
jgi:hypothetical protein